MSVSDDNMTKEDMVKEGNRRIVTVKEVSIPQSTHDFIQAECDKAFRKNDVCPVGNRVLYLPDLSSSMVKAPTPPLPWDQQQQFMEAAVRQAIEYGDTGIDIWPIFNYTELEIRGDPKIQRLLDVTDPSKAIQYVQGYEHRLRGTPTRRLFARLIEEVVAEAIKDPAGAKRTLFLISTDGNPDPEGPTMHETTNQAIMALHRANLDPTRYLAVSYVILTCDFHIMACYLQLEDNNCWGTQEKPLEFDIANAIFPFHIKALGGFDKKTMVNIALGGPINPEIDAALESILGEEAKSVMDLMKNYIIRGFAEEC